MGLFYKEQRVRECRVSGSLVGVYTDEVRLYRKDIEELYKCNDEERRAFVTRLLTNSPSKELTNATT